MVYRRFITIYQCEQTHIPSGRKFIVSRDEEGVIKECIPLGGYLSLGSVDKMWTALVDRWNVLLPSHWSYKLLPNTIQYK